MATTTRARPQMLDELLDLVVEDLRRDDRGEETIAQTIRAFRLMKFRLGVRRVADLADGLQRLAALEGISDTYRRQMLKMLSAALGRSVNLGLLRSMPAFPAAEPAATVVASPPPMPMAEFGGVILDRYRRKKGRPHTMRNVRVALGFAENRLGIRTTAELAEAPGRLAALSDISDVYRSFHGQQLRAICSQGVALGILPSVPDFSGIPPVRGLPKPPPTPKPGAPARVRRRMLEALEADDSWHGRRLLALALAWHDAGIPLIDALQLRAREFDLARGIIWYRRRRGARATEPARAVEMSARLKEALAGWLPLTGCKWAFPNRGRTGPWREHDARKQLHEHARAAGFAEGMTFEQLRGPGPSERTRPESATSPRPSSHTIRLGKSGQPTFIDGLRMEPVTESQYAILSALLDAGDVGLLGDQIEEITGQGGWRQTLLKLKQGHRLWDEIIVFPGRRSRPYRLDARREA